MKSIHQKHASIKVQQDQMPKRNVKKEGKGKRKRSLTKFEEYLELDSRRESLVSAEEDMALERSLGKKLKLKDGLLRDVSDGLSDLLEGLVSSSEIQKEEIFDRNSGSALQVAISQSETGKVNEDAAADSFSEDFEKSLSGTDGVDEDGHDTETENLDINRLLHLGNKTKKEGAIEDFTEQMLGCKGKPFAEENVTQATSEEASTKYIAPHRRTEDAVANNLSQQLQRRTRGLLNRLSEDNVESITRDCLELFQTYGRRVLGKIISNEILEAVCTGPRGNEKYAAVFAAFLAGITSSVGMDFAAKFFVSLAETLEVLRKKEDSLGLRNMLLLLSYLYTFKLISCGLIYDLLNLLSSSLMELDVSMILTVLQTCGMGLRADDPVAMKDFVVAVQHRCEDLKAPADQHGATLCMGKRMQFMLETICEIKNNRKRIKQEGNSHLRLQKWLQKVGVQEVQLRSLKWKTLLDPHKKGQWWIMGDLVDEESGIISEVTDFVRRETTDAEKMFQLAISQKMNTEIRRAIFCVVMSAEDYMDAFEKLLRLKLTGKQDREIMRVIVECCLQEKVFNKYYCLLIRKLCHHDKNHRFTLQYCLWDHFKQLDSMETYRLVNLGYLLADSIASFTLSLSVLKVVEFADTNAMKPKAVMFYCVALESLLAANSDEVVKSCFSRIACAQELENLRLKLSVFIHHHLMKRIHDKSVHSAPNEKMLLMKRISLAKKAMAGSSSL